MAACQESFFIEYDDVSEDMNTYNTFESVNVSCGLELL